MKKTLLVLLLGFLAETLCAQQSTNSILMWAFTNGNQGVRAIQWTNVGNVFVGDGAGLSNLNIIATNAPTLTQFALTSAVFQSAINIGSNRYDTGTNILRLDIMAQIGTATNTAINDATNRVALVGYLLPGSTNIQWIAVTNLLDSMSNSIMASLTAATNAGTQDARGMTNLLRGEIDSITNVVLGKAYNAANQTNWSDTGVLTISGASNGLPVLVYMYRTNGPAGHLHARYAWGEGATGAYTLAVGEESGAPVNTTVVYRAAFGNTATYCGSNIPLTAAQVVYLYPACLTNFCPTNSLHLTFGVGSP